MESLWTAGSYITYNPLIKDYMFGIHQDPKQWFSLIVFLHLDEYTPLLSLDIDFFIFNLFLLVTFLMCRMIYS